MLLTFLQERKKEKKKKRKKERKKKERKISLPINKLYGSHIYRRLYERWYDWLWLYENALGEHHHYSRKNVSKQQVFYSYVCFFLFYSSFRIRNPNTNFHLLLFIHPWYTLKIIIVLVEVEVIGTLGGSILKSQGSLCVFLCGQKLCCYFPLVK